ncbi:MAG: hypothetical protein M3421_14730 [Bacteroidota bacterium]|nr:hypothetical protein [Bacteroidota bacterium]
MKLNKLFSVIRFVQYFIISCCFLSTLAFGQGTTWGDDGEIESAEVIIEKDRKIELPPASRNFEKVPPPPFQQQKGEQSYQFGNFNYQVRDLDPKIRILTIKDEPAGKMFPNYIKGGIGNYFSTYGEAFINNARSKDFSYGAHFKHRAAARGPVDGTNSGDSQNSLNVNGKYFTPNIIFNGDLRISREKYYFYGYNPILEIDRSDIRQLFNSFTGEASIENINAKTPHYKVQASFTTLSDRFAATENQAGFNLESKFRLSDQLAVGLLGDLYLTSHADEIGKINRNLFRLKPHFLINTDLFRIKAGFNFVYENDTVSTGDKLHFYPFASLEYDIAPSFTAYAGIDGDIQRTSLAGFVSDNPFLAPNVALLHTNKTIEFFAGIKGKLVESLTFNVGVSAGNYNNMHFFINSAADSSKFDIIYEPENAALLNLFGELSFFKSDVFRTSVRGDLYDYSTNIIEEPWHRPTHKLSILSTYNIFNKIHLSGDLNVLGGIKAKNFTTNEVVDLDGIVDLSLKGDYLFSNRFSIFLSFNNILSKNYERYLYYPSRGLVVMGGVSYSF